jgi:hypothetical protein
VSCDVFKPKATAGWFLDGLKHPFDEAGHFPTDIHRFENANQFSVLLKIHENVTQGFTHHVLFLQLRAAGAERVETTPFSKARNQNGVTPVLVKASTTNFSA